jgi:hypothetical protein
LIDLSPTSLSFAATAGGANPAQQVVNVSNAGGGTVSGLYATVSYGSGAAWLNFALGNSAAPTTLTVMPSTGSLSAGTYTATIAVYSPVATNSPQTVAIAFTVSGAAGPSIALSQTSLSFTADYAGAAPPAQTVNITNGGGGTLTGLARNFGDGTPTWLGATLNQATAPAVLTVQPSTWCAFNACSPGTYRDTILVTSPVATNSPQGIAVTFTIAAPGEISAYASADNGVAYASQSSAIANTVYQSTQNGAGCDWSYTIIGTYDFFCAGTAFKFDVQSQIAGRTVQQATLRLYVYALRGDFSFTPYMRLRAFGAAWNPATLTWNNMPGTYTTGEIVTAAPVSGAVPMDFDVTAIVQNWASGAWTNNGFQLYPVIPNPPGYTSLETTWFQSLEYWYASDQRPRLIVTFQ